MCFTARYIVACVARSPMCENKIRAARQRCTIALRAKRQYVVVPYTKRRCTIGAVHRGRDAKFKPRAADEACTARVNANKF